MKITISCNSILYNQYMFKATLIGAIRRTDYLVSKHNEHQSFQTVIKSYNIRASACNLNHPHTAEATPIWNMHRGRTRYKVRQLTTFTDTSASKHSHAALLEFTVHVSTVAKAKWDFATLFKVWNFYIFFTCQVFWNIQAFNALALLCFFPPRYLQQNN